MRPSFSRVNSKVMALDVWCLTTILMLMLMLIVETTPYIGETP